MDESCILQTLFNMMDELCIWKTLYQHDGCIMCTKNVILTWWMYDVYQNNYSNMMDVSCISKTLY